MASVGFSTQGLYRSGMSYDKIINLCHSLGADAIELSFATPNQLMEFNLSESMIKNIKKFKSIYIHAPAVEVRYDDSNITQDIINKLRKICNKMSIDGIVLHPDTIDDFHILDKSALPFQIENMDKRKIYGTTLGQIKELKKKYHFGFVLDVQHAYEHDPSMHLAEEFIKVMGNRLDHMHISGHSESKIHVPLYEATNREAITKILNLGVNIPKILEGTLDTDTPDSMKKALDYVRKYERK